MTDAMQPAPAPGVPLSTTIDQGVPLGTGGGKVSLTEPVDAPKPDAKPETAGDTLKAELERIRSEEAKEVKAKGEDAAKDAKAKVDEAEKADKEEKPAKARAEDGKFAKAKTDGDEPDVEAKANKGEPEKAATERAETDKRQSEGRNHEPPARFLPEARTKWANVPNEVKAEFHRVSQEYEGEITKYKQAGERFEPIRQFDDIARSNGRELKDSLAKVARIEQHMARDPIGALDTVLREIGPRKQDGTPVSLYEVAQVIVQQGPQASRQSLAVANDEQESPQVKELARQVQEMKTQIATSSLKPMIEAFAETHPDYPAIEEQIASVLQSGVIEKIYGTGLSAEQKLAEAYRMAGGSSPSRSEPQVLKPHSDVKNVPSDDAGAKSIRGAPNGQDPDEGDDETDIRKLLKREARKLAS